MARDAEHGVEDARVEDAASAELGVDHESAGGGHEQWTVSNGPRPVKKELVVLAADH